MGQALYRKYRSKSLSEIIGQDHIITTLQNTLKNGSISHAYLFTGPKGVGKTSIARIMAHEINQLPYNEEQPHIDIIEIDAASNRRIDEIRDLRDKIHITPTSAKYKVYIIDEVHMLTKEAFNALLKTLEEPPEHVVFILATTEAHKLPETIISRTQRYSFKPIDQAKAVAHLRTIAKKEKISISDDALELIAEHGDGSFRDSISMLDQVSSLNKAIDVQDVRNMLGIAPQAAIDQLYKNTMSATPKDVIDDLTSLQDQGYEAIHLAKQLAQAVRHDLLNSNPANPDRIAKLLQQLIEVPASSDPTAKLEVVLLECNFQQLHGQKTEQDQPIPKVSKPSAPAAVTPQPTTQITIEPTDDFETAWANTLQTVKQQNNTLYGVLRMARAQLIDNHVEIAFRFPFHQKKLSEVKNRQFVQRTIGQYLGHPIEISCIVDKSVVVDSSALQKTVADQPAVLDTISNIFGTAEVLES